MEIIGENMHIMNQAFLRAVESRDEEALVRLAGRQVDAGATALDINLGRNRNLGRLTPWLVETIQQGMAVPLLLSSHVLDQQRALDVHRGTATINAVTADPAELSRAMETAKFFQANLVVLLVSSELTPMDVNGRLHLALQVLETADKTGLDLEQLYLDPVISCRPDPATWGLGAGLPDIEVLLDSIGMLGELSKKKLKTIVAISNSSVCLAMGERSAWHCRLLPLLAAAGLDAVIMNCLDKNLMAVAKNPQLVLSVAA
ncbi:MAG: dihydropteroate synthase [Desulfobacterales bacterium]|nr:dihydropteroate synthase [Desulfobacterales bacterium]